MRAVVIGTGGIGIEVVKTLRDRGHEVVIGWHKNNSDRSPGVRIDVTDLNSCQEFFATVWREFGPAQAVVNCFGVVEEAPLLRMDPAQMEQVLALNLNGVVHVCRAAAFRLMKAGGGTFVNVGSAASELGVPGLSLYSASKGALVSFGRSLAAELAPYRITCNTVLPGFVDCGATATRSPAWKAAVAKHIPLGRLGSAAEVAALVAHLVSPEARYVTGQEFVIDGGWTLGSAALIRDLLEAEND